MKKIYIVLCLIVSVWALQACKKNNDNPTPASTTNQNLLNTWKVSQVLEGSLDVTAEFTAYRLTLNESNGNKSFSLTDRQGTTITGNWSISTDETTLTLTPIGAADITFSNVTISVGELKYNGIIQGKTGNLTLAFTLIPA
ncbi:hypothetical protein BKI52_27930 [marine bacterium AO1-C]|nr:hypothetical protein BKI52_27930 [marine bacterium AO1-C]